MVEPSIGEIAQTATHSTQEDPEILRRTTGAPSADATHLVSLSAGLTQRVLISVMTPEAAVAILKTDVEALRPHVEPDER